MLPQPYVSKQQYTELARVHLERAVPLTNPETRMSFKHAVIWLDHHNAQILHFDAETSQAKHVKEHGAHTGQRNSAVRTEHEFFAEVCDAVKDTAEVLVTGSSTVQKDFQHYVEKHRSALSKQLAGFETVDHPSEKELIALGRKFFVGHDRMKGTAPMPAV